jgi:hypothetical protein
MNFRLALLAGLFLSQLSCDESQECADLEAGPDQDSCLKDEIQQMDSSRMEDVKDRASLISDSMIRSYAVSSWVKNHANDVALEDGRSLCELLEGREQSYCLRRLSSPHLQR